MVYRALMVMRMNPENAEQVAAAFAEHDRTTLPVEIGANRRTLFRFHDLYLHLIEADEDIMASLYRAREHPVFRKTNDRLSGLLTPYAPDWTELKDSKAEAFYTWEAD
ncbi:TcmI family type II polyketide cyclase [Amycolatopsis anabasis]|uniref:TcmI family type II polyketide cyclase n=1 Tax=Amycolatopsis anabasis TaxID=1840409 RepID=UPI00131C78EF|nr:TcmI family type II polyketide cyclase [Amycolatopsis anabasis]